MGPTYRAEADPIAVVRYDIVNALGSGWGSWSHEYTGTITRTSPPGDVPIATYHGGGGTLNDGIIGTSALDTELFFVPANTAITLYFAAFHEISGIFLFGGDIANNSIPGALNGTVTVSANGHAADLAAVPFGSFRGALNQQVNDRLSLLDSPLAGIQTDRITLSSLQSSDTLGPYFSLTEITVDGGPPAVPEPATLTLLGAGVLCALVRKRPRQYLNLRPPA